MSTAFEKIIKNIFSKIKINQDKISFGGCSFAVIFPLKPSATEWNNNNNNISRTATATVSAERQNRTFKKGIKTSI